MNPLKCISYAFYVVNNEQFQNSRRCPDLIIITPLLPCQEKKQ